MEIASPNVSGAEVTPRKPSATVDTSYPDLPDSKDLESSQPKSGILINEEKGSFYLVYKRGSKPGGLPFYISEDEDKKKASTTGGGDGKKKKKTKKKKSEGKQVV